MSIVVFEAELVYSKLQVIDFTFKEATTNPKTPKPQK